ncbi:sigma-70 family RNA polymerase sigma factor [Yeosuana marina]|uniref:sigma-70 family RNA polymerase sigma factor n=1 Tax=Yeosuana marina TaxID=1565536 RepID=UPI00141F528B|nr:sigma-70 family RNA polymerase sigma factor [Yeosuana marina]
MEQHYVDALKTENHFLIKELYNTNRNAFLNFAKQYYIAEMDSIDIYQEAFISLRKHAISGKLYDIKCTLKTYLFGIGKHLIYKKIKENSLRTNFDSAIYKVNDVYDEIQIEIENELTEEQLILQYYFKQLGKSCQQMLTLSFYRGLTNEEIATLEGYESEAVVRSQKSRCLKTLRDLIGKYPKK